MDTRARIRLLTADDSFWNQENPTLLLGEVGFRNVTGDDPLMRVGDGVRPWTQLPDLNKVGPAGPVGPVGGPGPAGPVGPAGPPGNATSPWQIPFSVADAGSNVLFLLDAAGFTLKASDPNRAFRVQNMNGSDRFAVTPEGQVRCTPAANLGAGFAVVMPNATVLGSYIAEFKNETAALGFNDGVVIRAGTNDNDVSLDVQNAFGGSSHFKVRGDGNIQMLNLPWSTFPNSLGLMTGNWLAVTSSSVRLKQDIHTVRRERARATVAQLRAVSYRSKCAGDNPMATCYGLIAEEVASVDPQLVTYNAEGKPQSVHYDRIAMLLLPLVQELLGIAEPAAI